MPRKYLWLVAGLVSLLAGAGCCRMCERMCPASAPQPCCCPPQSCCCPPPACGCNAPPPPPSAAPAPSASYAAPAGQWQRTYANNGCCPP
jgi:hypothetical protein